METAKKILHDNMDRFTDTTGKYEVNLDELFPSKKDIKWKSIPDYGDTMTLEHWVECVNSGGFIDYDGHGYLSDGTRQSNIIVQPSDVTKKKMQFPDWATHVIWFNK